MTIFILPFTLSDSSMKIIKSRYITIFAKWNNIFSFGVYDSISFT